MMSIKMSEAEKARFQGWLNSLGEDNSKECRAAIVNAVLKTERRAKNFAPVDKGFLKSSIHSQVEDMGGSVYTFRHYAPYKEFGTGDQVVAPADVKDYAMTFKGKGLRKVNQRAQPYLFPALRLSVKELELKLDNMGFKKL